MTWTGGGDDDWSPGRGAPLPAYLTRFVGRDLELQDLRQRLAAPSPKASGAGSAPPARLLTLCGVGGSGKTRLALELVRRLRQAGQHGAADFEGGVHWVLLAPIVDRREVPRVVAAAWGSALARSSDPIRSVINQVRDRRTLLVLDNCEHQLDACRSLVARVLSACPGLAILTTSREPLTLASECVVAVPPLASGVDKGPTSSFADHPSEAVQLFLDRAAMVTPTYAVSTSAAESVAAICQRLDGLPLAIELAASWMRVLTARDLLTEIDRNIAFLSAALPGLEERHRSMRAVLESSWVQPTPEDQQVLSALSVFAGVFSRAAAEAVAGATLSSLSALAEKSLIQRRPDSESETRYHMHELVKEHASGRLTAAGSGQERARQAHLAHFLALVEQTQEAWDTEGEEEWLERLRRDEANVNAALGWALDQQHAEEALRLSAGLFGLWIYTSTADAYQHPLERALALPWDVTSESSRRARARSLNVAGYAQVARGYHHRAVALFDEGLGLSRDLGDDSAVAWSLRGRGYARRMAGDVQRARAEVEGSLAVCRAIGDAAGEAWSVYDLGEVALAGGDLSSAETQLSRGLALFEERGIPFGAYRALVMLGEVALRQGQWPLALSRYDEALGWQRRAHFVARGAEIMEGLAEIALTFHQPEPAARLLGAGDSWRETFGVTRDFTRVDGYQRSMAAVARQLPASVRAASFRAGAELSPAQATDEAKLRVHELAALASSSSLGLTERELQVLHALARGLSNSQIAAQLVVSPRTVHAHVRSIFAKLRVSTRTSAARRATELNLV